MAIDTNTIIVSGAGSTEVNGTYAYDSNSDSYILSTNSIYTIKYVIDTDSMWRLRSNSSLTLYRALGNYDSNINSLTWDRFAGTAPVPTVAYAEITNPVIPDMSKMIITPTLTTPAVGDIGVLISSTDGYKFIPNAVPKVTPPIPDDYLFYLPLNTSMDVAPTGQEITYNSTLTYGVVDGIPCATFPIKSSGYSASFALSGLSGTPQATSIWFKMANTWTNTNSDGLLQTGYNQCGMSYNSTPYGSVNRTEMHANGLVDVTKWHNYIVNFDGSKAIYYVDGLAGDTINTSSLSYMYSPGFDANRYSVMYAAGARIYNRALTADEITALASEF